MSAVIWAVDALLGGVVIWRGIKHYRAKPKRRRYPRPTHQPVRHRG